VNRLELASGHQPKLERMLANSPAAFEGYTALRSALRGGWLPPQLRAGIALVVSEANGCEYCLSRDVERARDAGLTDAAIAEARSGRSEDERVRAVLLFAEGLVFAHGAVTDAELERLRATGLGDAEIVEVIANVTLTLGENYFALAAKILPDGHRVTPYYQEP
jgi:AhpD family alkylhydroperoxidase